MSLLSQVLERQLRNGTKDKVLRKTEVLLCGGEERKKSLRKRSCSPAALRSRASALAQRQREKSKDSAALRSASKALLWAKRYVQRGITKILGG